MWEFLAGLDKGTQQGIIFASIVISAIFCVMTGIVVAVVCEYKLNVKKLKYGIKDEEESTDTEDQV